jgi:hypothetical protein
LREDGWFALHDVHLDRGNIDHVLIGPAGIFTIETKSHRGRLRVDRIARSMLKQAYAEAKLVERVTELRADPLLVFSNAYLIPRSRDVRASSSFQLACSLDISRSGAGQSRRSG